MEGHRSNQEVEAYSRVGVLPQPSDQESKAHKHHDSDIGVKLEEIIGPSRECESE